MDAPGRSCDLLRLQFLRRPLQVAPLVGGGAGVDLLRAQQAVDADTIPCGLVPDPCAPAVARQAYSGTEPVRAGAPQIDGQLQFQGIAGDVFQVARRARDDSQVPLPVNRPPQGFDFRYRALQQLVVRQLQYPRDAVRADPVGYRVYR